MRLAGAVLAAASLWAAAGTAQDSPLHGLVAGADASAWEGVGRLDIGGKGFCTGTLIAPDLVLTAAHCLFEKATGARIDASRIRFLAGFRNGWSAASRPALRAIPHPGYRFDPASGAAQSRNDIALVRLDAPIDDPAVHPFDTAPEVAPGSQVSVVSYAVGRSEAPSLQDACDVLGQDGGVFVLSCDVDFGASGAPIFETRDGVPHIVSVVSAKGQLAGRRVSLGTSLTEPLAELRAAFDAAEPLPEPLTEPAPQVVLAQAPAPEKVAEDLVVRVGGDLNDAVALTR